MPSTTSHRSFWLIAIVIYSLFPSVNVRGISAQSVLNLDGKAVDPFLASAGKPVVLIFVRTDCPISNRYAPLLQKLHAAYSAKAAFWLVYPDKQSTAKQIQDHLREFGYTLAALRDPDHILVKRASASITPEAAVFDPQGKLLYHGRIDNWYEDAGRSRSAPTTHELESALEAAIDGKLSPVATAPAVGCYISDLQ